MMAGGDEDAGGGDGYGSRGGAGSCYDDFEVMGMGDVVMRWCR